MQGERRFEKIAAAVRDRIASGELGPGDYVPSVRDLADQHSTSRVTASHALDVLRSEGLIVTRVGARTVVTDHGGRPWLSTPQEHDQRARNGQPIYGANGETSVIYQAAVLPVDVISAVVASAVGVAVPNPGVIDSGAQVIKRARIMYDAAGHARSACTTWFPHYLIAQQSGGHEVIRRLTSTADEDRFRPYGTGRAIEDLYGKERTLTVDRVGVRGLPTEIAREMGLEPGERMLWTLSTRLADEYVIEVDETFRRQDDDLIYRY